MPYNPKSKLNLRPFVKGDPRINRAGVPPDAIAARRFVQELGAEVIKAGDEELTRFYAMVRIMFNSRHPKDREILIKIMFPGLLKDEHDITSGGKPIETKVDDERFDRAISTLADAIRESVPGTGAKPDGEVGPAE